MKKFLQGKKRIFGIMLWTGVSILEKLGILPAGIADVVGTGAIGLTAYGVVDAEKRKTAALMK